MVCSGASAVMVSPPVVSGLFDKRKGSPSNQRAALAAHDVSEVISVCGYATATGCLTSMDCARSATRHAYPHSLSYQATTLTIPERDGILGAEDRGVGVALEVA